MSDLLSVSDALARLLAVFNPTPLERLPLAQALGRVTASEISASLDLPPFTNSAMDGFALRAVDVAGASRTNPQTLAVAADIPAGASSSAAIAPGQAARIMTGAAIPAGAKKTCSRSSRRRSLKEDCVSLTANCLSASAAARMSTRWCGKRLCSLRLLTPGRSWIRSGGRRLSAPRRRPGILKRS